MPFRGRRGPLRQQPVDLSDGDAGQPDGARDRGVAGPARHRRQPVPRSRRLAGQAFQHRRRERAVGRRQAARRTPRRRAGAFRNPRGERPRPRRGERRHARRLPYPEPQGGRTGLLSPGPETSRRLRPGRPGCRRDRAGRPDPRTSHPDARMADLYDRHLSRIYRGGRLAGGDDPVVLRAGQQLSPQGDRHGAEPRGDKGGGRRVRPHSRLARGAGPRGDAADRYLVRPRPDHGRQRGARRRRAVARSRILGRRKRRWRSGRDPVAVERRRPLCPRFGSGHDRPHDRVAAGAALVRSGLHARRRGRAVARPDRYHPPPRAGYRLRRRQRRCGKRAGTHGYVAAGRRLSGRRRPAWRPARQGVAQLAVFGRQRLP